MWSQGTKLQENNLNWVHFDEFLISNNYKTYIFLLKNTTKYAMYYAYDSFKEPFVKTSNKIFNQ